MTEQARREYAEVMRARYQEADKRERGAMLDEYCRVTGCHRKAAIRRLRATPRRPRRGSGRPPRYGRDLLPLLARVWQASDYLSGKVLRPIVPALVSALQRHHGLVVSAAAHAALLAASPATLDRLLRPCGGAGGRAHPAAWRRPCMRCARRSRCRPGASGRA